MEIPVMESFEQWKEFLSRQVYAAQEAGASQESIVSLATRIGNFLAERVDPKNREQRLLKELWDKGTEEERRALASMLTKLVSDGEVH
ncbi:MAG TPA: DUF3243 domain-containing protein [Symbiobacteriaceae bacterium]